MTSRFIDRIDAVIGPRREQRGLWTCFAIFFAAALGFELGSFRWGHRDPTQVVFVTAFFLLSTAHLPKWWWLRASLWITAMPLMIISFVMLIGYHRHS